MTSPFGRPKASANFRIPMASTLSAESDAAWGPLGGPSSGEGDPPLHAIAHRRQPDDLHLAAVRGESFGESREIAAIGIVRDQALEPLVPFVAENLQAVQSIVDDP